MQTLATWLQEGPRAKESFVVGPSHHAQLGPCRRCENQCLWKSRVPYGDTGRKEGMCSVSPSTLVPLGLGSKAILSLPRHCWSWLLTSYYTPETGSENTEHIGALQLKCSLRPCCDLIAPRMAFQPLYTVSTFGTSETKTAGLKGTD